VAVIFGANAFPAGDDSLFIKKMHNLLPDKIKLIHATSEVQWLSEISSSRLLISGRFHHSIAAACLRTPFVVLDSNTPKIDGLMEDLQLPTQLHCADQNISGDLEKLTHEIINAPESYLLKDEVYRSLLERAKNNFTNI
jgi:polysaccharide pyruvyl transferase WcaK-like protein